MAEYQNEGCEHEKWLMLKDSMVAAQYAIKCGIENTQELLADYDARVGRTTRSNRLNAERIEQEIALMSSALMVISKANG